MNTGNKLAGTLTGAATAALFFWNQNETDRDDRLRNLRLDNRDLQDRLNEFLASPDMVRLTMPIMRDANIGLAAASPTSAQASTVPPVGGAGVVRPDLTSFSNIQGLVWPPAVGTYDPTGRTTQPGQMGQAFYTFTYQEVQSFLQGLTQKAPPGPDGQLQLAYAAQGLSVMATAQRWTAPQWAAFWASLAGMNTTALDAHRDPAKTPTAFLGAAAQIVPLASPTNTYANKNTDAASRWRITAIAGGGNNAGDVLATINFATTYRYLSGGNLVAFQPVVTTNRQGQIYASNITPTGFDLVASIGLGASQSFDVFVSVDPGMETA